MSYVIEGTFTEVQERLSALPLQPESHLRVTIDDKDLPEASLEQFLVAAERKNGLIMVPSRNTGIPITLEMVKELQEDEL